MGFPLEQKMPEDAWKSSNIKIMFQLNLLKTHPILTV